MYESFHGRNDHSMMIVSVLPVCYFDRARVGDVSSIIQLNYNMRANVKNWPLRGAMASSALRFGRVRFATISPFPFFAREFPDYRYARDREPASDYTRRIRVPAR
jgi:hypothetical protein